MKQKDLIKKISEVGFYFDRSGGNHDIYSNGKIKISIPRHKEVNEKLAKGILKQAGVK